MLQNSLFIFSQLFKNEKSVLSLQDAQNRGGRLDLIHRPHLANPCPIPTLIVVDEETEVQASQGGRAELERNHRPSESDFGVSSGLGGVYGLPEVDARPHHGATWIRPQTELTPSPSWNRPASAQYGERVQLLLPVSVSGECQHLRGRNTLYPGSWPTGPGATHPGLGFSAPSLPSGDSQVVSGPALIGQPTCQSWGCLAPVLVSEPTQLPPGEEEAA